MSASQSFRGLLWALSSVLLVAGPAGLRAQETLVLKFAVPPRQPAYYENVLDEVVRKYGSDLKSSEGMEKTTLHLEQTMSTEYTAMSEESLDVRSKIIDYKVTVNGKDAPFQPTDKEASRVIDVKGYRKMVGKGAGDFDKFDVILPVQPVKVGDSWAYTAPPTSDMPVYLITHFTLDRLGKEGDVDCAYISAKTDADGVAPERNLRVKVNAQGKITFAYKDGYLIKSAFRVQIISEPAKGNGTRVSKISRSLMSLQRLGD